MRQGKCVELRIYEGFRKEREGYLATQPAIFLKFKKNLNDCV